MWTKLQALHMSHCGWCSCLGCCGPGQLVISVAGLGPHCPLGCALFCSLLVQLWAGVELTEWAQAKGPGTHGCQLCGWPLRDGGSCADPTTLPWGGDSRPSHTESSGGCKNDAPAHPFHLTAAAAEDSAEGGLGDSPGRIPRTRIFRNAPPSCAIMINSYELGSAKASSRGSMRESHWVLKRSQGARVPSLPWMSMEVSFSFSSEGDWAKSLVLSTERRASFSFPPSLSTMSPKGRVLPLWACPDSI